ncbi:hypothetical protein Vretimale_13583 [Volvox reticuliferus]|uniref:Uncharacterized protein n=1 Tax=Volvox reticuliferus TaxID=1737510 RepID=A0A8J4BU21_9CHLO|nr:hypothetical protein Vretifemale_397 [Volvox reticuliferus]GIM09762.1 hypothetical protein Vretimale_13583 [Volvox reticuliferus]
MSAILAILALARDNKADDIRRLVTEGEMAVDAANEFGQTALHVASLWGNLEAMKVLIELGADVDVPNSRGSTPLHFAASAKRHPRAVCQILLDAGADTEAVDLMGRQPYEMANDEDVRSLLGGPDARIFAFASEGNAAALRSLLAEAAAAGKGDMGDDKEPRGISLRVVDNEGSTPLNLAIAAESLETVKVILEHDPAMIDYPDMSGNTPLHAAVEAGNLDVLRYLLSRQPPPEMNVQNMHASEYAQGNWMLGGETLEPFDKTPLHMAVEAGDVEAVKMLLETGCCNVNLLDFDKSSPLHLALDAEDEEMAERLLRAGANPDQPNPDFKSPLHLAASRGKLSMLRLLIEVGRANVRGAVSDDGWTPLHLAARGGAVDKVGVLVAAGANVEAAIPNGNTALHLAAINGHVAVVRALLEAGANKDAKNREGKRPADVAKTKELMDLLE